MLQPIDIAIILTYLIATIIIGLAVLIHFYKNTHPWGAWDPIHHKIIQKEPDFQRNTAFKRDMFNVVIGVIGQTLLVVIPLYIILHEHISLMVSLIILVVCVVILKRYWWDKMNEVPHYNY